MAATVPDLIWPPLKSLIFTAFEDHADSRGCWGRLGTAAVYVMKTVLKFTLPAALLAAFVLGSAPLASAQSEDELASRLSRMEEQMQQLMGQVEQLTFEVRRLQGGRKSGDLGQPVQQKKRQVAVVPPESEGVEQIEGDTQYTQAPLRTIGDDEELPEGAVQRAPGPKILGTLPGTAYQQGTLGDPQGGGSYDQNGEFQGQVLVAPGGGDGQGLVPPANGGGEGGNDLVPERVETVALGNAASGDPEAVYERSYESLLRRQFNDAEVGFRSFLDQHRTHSLAGNAQYWLGETYYVQGDYKQAAQAFLSGYRDFPKSRKAADSLLKLGLSLNRLGQKEQACAAYMQVGSQFPKSAEARKRAQSEIKRAGC
jgi:tol-pal system protein YbgF